MKRPRLLLADDHAIVAEGLRKLLEPECDVVGMVGDGRALVREALNHRPDIVIVDVAMPLLNGIEAARQIHTLLPKTKLVFVTMYTDATFAAEAFNAGASGYLLKRSAASELMRAIRLVLSGGRYVAPELPAEVDGGVKLRHQQPSGHLTGRQREVLQLVAEGRAVKEIGHLLGISTKTVEFHKSRIMARLEIHTTAELTKYAIAHGIVSA